MRFILAAIAAFLITSVTEAATVDELANCAVAADPSSCFIGLQQACQGDDACLYDVKASWQDQRTAAAERETAKVQAELAALKATQQQAAAQPAPVTQPAVAPPPPATQAAREPVNMVSVASPANYRGTAVAFTLRRRHLSDQWTAVRTFGLTVRFRVDSQPVPIIYSGGEIRTVPMDNERGTINLEAVSIDTDGNPAFLMGPSGGVLGWDIVVLDETTGNYVATGESRHYHVKPTQGRDSPRSISVHQGLPPGF